MGAADSAAEESFSTGLLEYPHYTRPAEWRGRRVPDVLLVRPSRRRRRMAPRSNPSDITRATPPRSLGGPHRGLDQPSTHDERTPAMNIIQQYEADQIASLSAARAVPEFAPGDTVRVAVKVVEGDRTRTQAFEGVCIARSNKGLNSNFTVRKISYGEGVERVFPLYAPTIAEITVIRRGDVRRAKLYYLRGRRGKSARIAEKARAIVSATEAAPRRKRPRRSNRCRRCPALTRGRQPELIGARRRSPSVMARAIDRQSRDRARPR